MPRRVPPATAPRPSSTICAKCRPRSICNRFLAFGLGVTLLSDLPSLRLFGKLSAMTLVAALIDDLVLLPASVLLYRRFIRRLRLLSGQAPAHSGSGQSLGATAPRLFDHADRLSA